MIHKEASCLVPAWISIFEEIGWMNHSVTHKDSLLFHKLISGFKKSLEGMIQWLIQKKMFCLWMFLNGSIEWFNGLIIKTVACLGPQWIIVFEWISWMNNLM